MYQPDLWGEFLRYIYDLPNIDAVSLRHKILEVWENSSTKNREEAGVFHAFDFSLTNLVNPLSAEYLTKLMECQTNMILMLENKSFRIRLTRIHINGVPTGAHEVIIFPKQEERFDDEQFFELH